MTQPDSRFRSAILIGSSGGGMAALGDTSVGGFVETIRQELSKIDGCVDLREVVLVSLLHGRGMDYATDKDEASLFHLAKGCQSVTQGTLREINKKIIEIDESIANDIELGFIDGIISVSCKPDLFSQSLGAASTLQVPLTGTGGSSLSTIASKYQIKIVGNAGGSVATTPLTKAISFSFALAQFWGHSYRPWLSSSTDNAPKFRSVLNSCLPVFWGVSICKRMLQHSRESFRIPDCEIAIHMLQSYAIPATCCIIMASHRRRSPGVLMSAVFASVACKKTVIGGLLAGWAVADFEERLLYICITKGSVPATMTNLLTSGFVGAIVFYIMSFISPYLSELTELYRELVNLLVSSREQDELQEIFRLLALSTFGAVFCYGSKKGWYHSIFLPLILLEMELGETAILGAMDQLTLVLVSAGSCAGALMSSLFIKSIRESRPLMTRGILINLLCGDFIEACYPLMERNSIVRFGGYLASSMSVALLSSECKSSAYLPMPLTFWLSDDLSTFSLASGIAFGVSFISTIIGIYVHT